MKNKTLLTIFAVFLNLILIQAQHLQTINVNQAGNLGTLLGANKTKVTDLTLTGIINEADFTTIKQMTVLKNLNMSDVDIENGTIPAQAFAYRVMDKLVLPKSLRKIDTQAFYQTTCPKLDFSKSPDLQILGAKAFDNIKLTNNTLDFTNNTKLNQFLTFYTDGTFAYFNGNVILPNNLEVIPSYTFTNFGGNVELSLILTTIQANAFLYSSIEEISLPKSVTYIGDNAFVGCKELTKIISLNTTPPNLGRTVFNGVDVTNCRLFVPDKGLPRYAAADQWKDFINTMRSAVGTNTLIQDELIQEETAISIYPNPTSDVINISGTNIEDIKIYGTNGRLIRSGGNSNTINIQDLSSGIYIIKIKTSKGLITEKVMKK